LIDPEAAKITLNANFSKTTVVGDVTSQVIATQEFADEVYDVKNAYTELFYNHFNKGTHCGMRLLPPYLLTRRSLQTRLWYISIITAKKP
jgi:hypothetical protein